MKAASFLALAMITAAACSDTQARAVQKAPEAAVPGAGVKVTFSDHPLPMPSFKLTDVTTGKPIDQSQWRGKVVLLNFWATWCGPCVIEMPLLDRFARAQGSRGWQVLALAVDQVDPVRRFIAERGLKLPVAIAGAVGLDLSRQLGNVQGGLPFTAAFDSTGAAVQRRLGPVSADLLSTWTASTR